MKKILNIDTGNEHGDIGFVLNITKKEFLIRI